MKELDMQELFSNNASSVQSDRILYTPSAFARGRNIKGASSSYINEKRLGVLSMFSCIRRRGKFDLRWSAVFVKIRRLCIY